MTTPEQHFARFRGHADGGALAAVFDALAPELLLVAAHLAPVGAEPEDLVQATFLDAIEKAPRWDAARPLMPWLIGILVNHARLERRRLARAVDAQRLDLRAEPDPFDALAAGETAEQVGAALRGLPRQYRQALALRLVHGLTPTQIAHAMGCPVPTVKTRLQRGMEWLRKSLPVGIAPAVAGALAPGRGLAEVRALVLAQVNVFGPAAATAVPAGVIGGVLFMNKVTFVAAAAVCAAAVWFFSRDLGAPAVSDGSTLVTADAATGRAPESRPIAAPPGSDAPTGRLAVAAEPARDGSAVLEFVWKDDGDPAPGLKLFVSRMPDAPTGATMQVTAERRRSDSAGLLAMSSLRAGSYFVNGSAFSQSVVVRSGEQTRARIEVQPDVRLDGVVVDGAGRGVAGASVLTQDFADREEPEPRLLATARADGTFRCAAQDPGSVWARKTGFEPSRLTEVAGRGAVRVKLVLGGTCYPLRGIVRGADGVPVAGALLTCVRASEATEKRAPLSLRSGPAGGFATDELAAGEHILLASAPAHAATMVRFTSRADREELLEIRLELGATVHGTVRDGPGRPVRAVVEVQPRSLLEPQPLRNRRVTSVACDANGSFRLEHVTTGAVHLVTSGDGVAYDTRDLDLADEQVVRCDITVAAGVIRGRVLDRAGEPLAGWTVWANPDGPGTPRNGTTSGDGRFVLSGLGDGEHSVRAWPEDAAFHLPWAEADHVRPGGSELELRGVSHAAGARLSGRLVDAAGRPVPRADVAVSPDGDPRGITSVTTVADPEGRLALGPLPPGRYRVVVRMGGHGSVNAGTHDLPAGSTVDLGTLRAAAAGSLAVRLVTSGGHAVEPAELSLRDDAGNGGAVTERGTDGGWRTVALPAGAYTVRAWGETFAPLEQEVHVLAARETPVELTVAAGAPVQFAFPRPTEGASAKEPRWLAEVQLVVKDDAGRVVAGQLLAVATADTFTWTRAFAPGRYTWEALVWRDGTPARGAFEVAGEPGAVRRIEVRLSGAKAR